MSLNKPTPTELDLAEDEFLAELAKKYKEPSEINQTITAPTVSSLYKSHDVRVVTSALNDILSKDCAPPQITTPSVSATLSSKSISGFLKATSNNLIKRSSSSQPDDQASKFKKLDANDEFNESELDKMEDALLAEYMDQEKDDGQQEESDSDGENIAVCPNSLDVDGCDDESCSSDDDNDEEANQISCIPCSPNKRNPKSNDNDLKKYSFNIPRMFMENCRSECKFGGKCVEDSTFKEMRSMVTDFWDEYDCKAPSAATRRLKILKILQSAYRPNSDQFEFYAGCKEKNNRAVCEAAYLILLGLSNSPHASKAPGQWQRLKKYVREGKDREGIKYSANDNDQKQHRSGQKELKKRNAVAYIQWFAKEFGDTIPGSEGKIYDVYICTIYVSSQINTFFRCR